MSGYVVRSLQPDDFALLMRLEENVFGGDGTGTLGPYYVRLCCDFFRDTCFIALHDDEPVGYLLSFTRDRECYCTTLAVVEEHQGTRVAALLIRAFCGEIVGRVDSCWFTVEESNAAARALHATLGAEEVDFRADFYGPGDGRIVSKIDSNRFEKLRGRYERLGLIRHRPAAVPSVAT